MTIVKSNYNAQSKLKYDWVIFDFGGTLNHEQDPVSGEDKESMQIIYGKILKDWFEFKGYKVKPTEKEFQEFTIKAHEILKRDQFLPKINQKNLLENINYYSCWMEEIYHMAGIKNYTKRTELEMARLYLIEEYGERKKSNASSSVVETLRNLKKLGVKMGVLSNNAGYVEDSVYMLGIHDYFEFFVDSARVNCIKPYPEIFNLTKKVHGVKTDKILYVGDSFQNDVVGAIAASWDVAWINEGRETLSCERLKVIHNIEEILKLCVDE